MQGDGRLFPSGRMQARFELSIRTMDDEGALLPFLLTDFVEAVVYGHLTGIANSSSRLIVCHETHSSPSRDGGVG